MERLLNGCCYVGELNKKTRWHLSFAHAAKYGATRSPIVGPIFP